MSSQTGLLDEPRSWRELLVETVARHSTMLYTVGVVFFGGVFLYGVAVLIHVEVTTIGWLARAEAEYGASLADEVVVPGVYLQLGINLVAFVVCAREVLNRVIGRW